MKWAMRNEQWAIIYSRWENHRLFAFSQRGEEGALVSGGDRSALTEPKARPKSPAEERKNRTRQHDRKGRNLNVRKQELWKTVSPATAKLQFIQTAHSERFVERNRKSINKGKGKR
ncbi:hypothetical protein [uncultured Neglectibacter sp.]|uniref:hypothetical protein n=1 Tax=uncultured Neglectibacter sp. TaxID=1924108 RepID=UPI0034DEF43A